MRKLYVVADFPPTEDDMATATSLGATEIVSVPEGEDFPVNVPGYGYHEVEPPLPPGVPSPISRMQARVALAQLGKLDLIDAFFDDPTQPLTPAQREYWKSALEFHRGHPLIAQFGPMLGWTDSQIDNLFRLGAGIA